MISYRRRKAGFTLIEILIALAIVSGALITIIYTVNFHLSLIQRHETITTATMLGSQKIREVTEMETVRSGAFPEPYEEYTFDMVIEDSLFEGIKIVKLSVTKEKETVYLNKFIEKKR